MVTLFCAAKWRLFCLADGPMNYNGITAGPNSSEVLPSSRVAEEEPSTCHFRIPRLSSFQSPSLLHVIWTHRSSRSCPDVYRFSVRRHLQLSTFRLVPTRFSRRLRCALDAGRPPLPALPPRLPRRRRRLNLVVGLNMYLLIP